MIIFFGVSSRKHFRSSQNQSTSASVVGAQTWITVILNGFALEMNQDHFVHLEIAPKYCISDSFLP